MDVNRETSCCSAQTKTEENYKQEIKPRIKDEDNYSESSSLKQEAPIIGQEEDELETAKAEMGEVKEENERLKKMLERIENDYKCLQMRFFDILKRDQSPSTISENKSLRIEPQKEEEEEEPQVSLSLGLQVLNKKRKKDDYQSSTSCLVKEDVKMMSDGLSLGLELELRGSPTIIDLSEQNTQIINDDDDGAKQDNTGETCPPSKVLNTAKDDDFKEEESSQRNSSKRARVSVRARCDTPTMNDGCQWRKYGQKIAKGNPCPRAYYRCTVAQSCPVRKQVQRCSEDTSILITTYEGTHNHPLSSAATAMASTTSAAASILLSGSSTSNGGVLSPCSTPTMSTTNLNGLHFNLYHHNNNNNSRNNNTAHFNLPNSSSPLPPTITLDLTSSPSSHFNRHRHTASTSHFLQSPLFSHTYSSSSSPSSRSLDFSSSETKPNFPLAWSNNINHSNTHFNYASLFPSNNKTTPIIGSINFGSKPTFEQPSYLERMNQTASCSSSSSSQQFLTETLTKVLTSDPSFQSAVAAAISSMVGSTNHSLTNNSNLTSIISCGKTENSNHNLKWIDQNGKGCAPTYLNNPNSSSTTTSNSQPAANLMLLHPPFPFSLSKSSSSPDLRD